MLLLRERAKFSPARRKVKIATGIAKAMSRTKFGLTTPPEEIAAVRSKNEFLEAPFRYRAIRCNYSACLFVPCTQRYRQGLARMPR